MDLKDCKNVNDIVGLVAARAKALADEKIDYLRRSVASENAHTDHAIWMETKHRSRGDMIEEILMEEFNEEFPREIVQED